MKPDFLYIGAPRAASTWLWRNLQAHPDIWVPPCKNIGWFHPRFQMYRLKILRHFGGAVKPEDKAWYRRFFGRPFGSVRWYASLFPTDQIAGEIAEAYCSLNEKRIAKIVKLNPQMKIIFVLRNPYERALSHARLGVLKRKGKAASTANMLAHIDHPSSEARSFYSVALKRWEAPFPAEQFFIRFYEDVQDDPRRFLTELYAFLGANYNGEVIEERVNTAPTVDLPEAVIQHTARKYHEEIKVLAERFGGSAADWLTQVETIISE